MKKGLFPIFLIHFLFLGHVAYGQKGNIHGFVKEAATGDAMIGASVFIKGTSTGTVTDFNGEFTLSGIDEGEETVEFSYLGFTPLTQVVNVVAGATQELTIAMEYESVSLIEGEVIVTAQASAQMAAINKQRSSNTIANVISVKRIQELPDANAAEVVGRLPGVSLQREGGEGSKVVIRGLAPKYNSVTIEGVKMASTGGDDRSTDMSMISPYMLEGIEVFKAAMPDKEANAHGGTVNFVLKEAPKGLKLNALGLVGETSLGQSIGTFKGVVGLSNRFFKNKLGIFAQVDFENRNRNSNELIANYFTRNYDILTTTLNNFVLQEVDRKINRKGGVLVFDYKIPNGKIKLSSFTSSINKEYILRKNIYNIDGGYHSYAADLSNTNLLISSNSITVQKTLGAFKLDGQLSYSLSKNNSPHSISFEAREDSGYNPGIDVDSVSASDAIKFAKNNYNLGYVNSIARNSIKTNENQTAYSLNLLYSNTLSKSINFKIKIGGKYRTLVKKYDRNNKFIPVTWGGSVGGDPFRAAVAASDPKLLDLLGEAPSKLPYNLFVDLDYSNSDFLQRKYKFEGAPNIDWVKRFDEIAGSSFAGTSELYKTDFPKTIMADYHGQERYYAGYIMSELNFGKKVKLIPGIRYENNQTEYTGNRGNQQAFQIYQGYKYKSNTKKRENSFWLPMVQLKLKPTKWLDIRAAYTNTLSRPNYNRIYPFWNITLTTVAWNNPYLEPSKSENLDLSLSTYDSKIGLVSVGAFTKKVENLIFYNGVSVIFDPSDYELPDIEAGKTITITKNNKFPLRLWGIEAEWKTRFWYLNNFLKGAVLNLNYTHTASKVKYPRTEIRTIYSDEPPYVVLTSIDTFYNDRFVLQPDDIFNATVGYDYKGFSARVSYLFRANVFAKTSIYPNLRAESDNYSRWDVSFKQSLPKGVELLFNFGNITSYIERNLLVQRKYPIKEQDFGRTIDLAIRYRFQ